MLLERQPGELLLGNCFFEDWVLGWRLGQKCRFEICRVLGWETWAKYVFWNCLQNFLKVKSSGGRLGRNMWFELQNLLKDKSSGGRLRQKSGFEIVFKTFWRPSLRGGDLGKDLDLKFVFRIFWKWSLRGGDLGKICVLKLLGTTNEKYETTWYFCDFVQDQWELKGISTFNPSQSRVPCVHLLRKLYQAFRHRGASHVIVLVGRLVNNSHQKGAALNFSPVDIKYKL